MSDTGTEVLAGVRHDTAIIDRAAELHPSVSIGPFSVIGPGVVLDEGVVIDSHVYIARDTFVGADSHIHKGAVLGTDPQHLNYAGEATRLEVGARTTIREYATLNRGTVDLGVTTVGDECLIMAYGHVAHDCTLGDHVVIGNTVQMAGHCDIDDWAIVGGLTGIHQFVRIGCHSFIGGGSRVPQDVAPYVLVAGSPCAAFGLNLVGLRRRGFDKETLAGLRAAYRTILQGSRNTSDSLDIIEAGGELSPEVQHLVEFISASKRGITT